MLKFLNDKFLTILIAFLISAIVEFLVRASGSYTLGAFFFYGLYNIALRIIVIIDEDNKR